MLNTAKLSQTFNIDNLEYMKSLPDNAYDLGLCDPEYRDENQPDINLRRKGAFKEWFGLPTQEYFDELLRVTKHQIIFGGNYFTDFKGISANNNWFIWDKGISDGLHFSMAEMAWVSIRKNIKIFKYRPAGEAGERKSTKDWHETSKPIQLYAYILKTYAQKGWSILDTNLGSGNSRKAAYFLGHDFTGLELNKDFYEKEKSDFDEYVSKFGLFLPPEISEVKVKQETKKELGIVLNDDFTLE